MRAWISSGGLIVGLSFLKRRCRALPIIAIFAIGGAALGGGCPTSKYFYSGPSTAVPITEFRVVAGRWAGPLTAEGRPRRDDDWVDLTIGEDGSYAFAAPRSVGPFVGKGKFELRDGKLVMDGERGRASFTLLQGDGGGRQLRGDAVLASGPPMWVDLLKQ